MNGREGTGGRDGAGDRFGPGRALALLPAILSGLILRRSGLVPANDQVGARSDGTGNPVSEGGPVGAGAPDGEGEHGRHERPDDAPPYETEDVRVGRTGLIVLGLALTVAAVIGGLAWMRHAFTASQRAALPPLTRAQTAAVIPPAPNLQPEPYADIDRILAAQARALDSYGFADPERTRARIPIDRAIALTLGKSLDP